jgi:hypothetical protein
MVAALTGKEPDVTPEIASALTTRGTSFSSDNAVRELGYRTQAMEVAVGDNYTWLVKEGLLAKSR